MNEQKRFTNYTEKLRSLFPTWTAIRKDPQSIGAQLLSVIGLTLDEVEWMLAYAYEQTHIATADIDQLAWVYKARLPTSLNAGSDFRLVGGSHVLQPTEEETGFIEYAGSDEKYGALQRDTSCYVDFEKKFVYVKYAFGRTLEDPFGSLSLTIRTEDNEAHEKLPLLPQAVWNFFDEFGLLLGATRLQNEGNAEYRERILDIFRRPSSASRQGMFNGIARDLGLIRETEWKNGNADLALSQPRIDWDSIQVNGESGVAVIAMDEDGRTLLGGKDQPDGQVIRYVAGLSLHELHDATDTELQSRLYDIDGNATPLLTYYVESIRRRVPIMWGEWRWNQGTWDAGENGYQGFNALPTLYDGGFSGWTKEGAKTWN